jgi:hypothetical protein
MITVAWSGRAGQEICPLAAEVEALLNGKARCATCHVPPLFTEPGWGTHKADEIGIDDFQAKRSPDESYHTAVLRALWDTSKIHKGGFYHDGRFANLDDVVKHDDEHFGLQLSEADQKALIEYLKSIWPHARFDRLFQLPRQISIRL